MRVIRRPTPPDVHHAFADEAVPIVVAIEGAGIDQPDSICASPTAAHVIRGSETGCSPRAAEKNLSSRASRSACSSRHDKEARNSPDF